MRERVIASYCTTFLKREMLHIYRQVTSLQSYSTFVMTKAVQNAELFPFDDIELIDKPPRNPIRHGYLKYVAQRPPIVYRGEFQMLSKLLDRRGADLMHIYFGHTGVHLLPFIERWNKPCVVSFHGADVATKSDIRDYGLKLQNLFHAVPLVLRQYDTLTLCYHAGQVPTRAAPEDRAEIEAALAEPPAEFDTARQSIAVLLVLKRKRQ